VIGSEPLLKIVGRAQVEQNPKLAAGWLRFVQMLHFILV